MTLRLRSELVRWHGGEVIKELRSEIETVVPNYGVHLDAKSTEELLLSSSGEDGSGVIEDCPLQIHDTLHAIVEFDADPVITIVACTDDPNGLAFFRPRWLCGVCNLEVH